jgi:hypothetical protein
MLLEGLCLAAGSVPSVRVVLPGDAGVIARRAAGILDRQITERCGAKVLTAGEAAWAVELGIEAGIGKEGYKIVDGPGGSVRILCNDDLPCRARSLDANPPAADQRCQRQVTALPRNSH